MAKPFVANLISYTRTFPSRAPVPPALGFEPELKKTLVQRCETPRQEKKCWRDAESGEGQDYREYRGVNSNVAGNRPEAAAMRVRPRKPLPSVVLLPQQVREKGKEERKDIPLHLHSAKTTGRRPEPSFRATQCEPAAKQDTSLTALLRFVLSSE